jgi:ankyrin repeat protein
MEDTPQPREVRVNTRGFTPLLYAVANNHPSVVQLLIDSKVDMNNTDDSGNTPLIVASYMGFNDIVTILINAGADLDIQNKNGSTALIVASQSGKVPIWDFPESVCE